MPRHEVSTVSLRSEFVMLAMQVAANMTELCRRFGVSRKTGYRWLKRHAQYSMAGLTADKDFSGFFVTITRLKLEPVGDEALEPFG